MLSATPSVSSVIDLVDETIFLVDSAVLEFKNQKLCDSHKVTDILLDIRNLVSNLKRNLGN